MPHYKCQDRGIYRVMPLLLAISISLSPAFADPVTFQDGTTATEYTGPGFTTDPTQYNTGSAYTTSSVSGNFLTPGAGTPTTFTVPGNTLTVGNVQALQANPVGTPIHGGNLLFDAAGKAVYINGKVDVSGLAGGNGGSVRVNAAHLVQNGQIYARGSKGGVVIFDINQAASTGSYSNVVFQEGSVIDTSGGLGAVPIDANYIGIKGGMVNLNGLLVANGIAETPGAYDVANGGGGGTINVEATHSTIVIGSAITPYNGTDYISGVYANGANGANAGSGGDGGNITLKSLETIVNKGVIQANGGNGSDGQGGTFNQTLSQEDLQLIGDGGNGGTGGNITLIAGTLGNGEITDTTQIVNNGTIQANGGNGGNGKTVTMIITTGGSGGPGNTVTDKFDPLTETLTISLAGQDRTITLGTISGNTLSIVIDGTSYPLTLVPNPNPNANAPPTYRADVTLSGDAGWIQVEYHEDSFTGNGTPQPGFANVQFHKYGDAGGSTTTTYNGVGGAGGSGGYIKLYAGNHVVNNTIRNEATGLGGIQALGGRNGLNADQPSGSDNGVADGGTVDIYNTRVDAFGNPGNSVVGDYGSAGIHAGTINYIRLNSTKKTSKKK